MLCVTSHILTFMILIQRSTKSGLMWRENQRHLSLDHESRVAKYGLWSEAHEATLSAVYPTLV